MLLMSFAKSHSFVCKLTVMALLAVLISACAQTQPQPATLDELMRRSDFKHCMLDSGVTPDQLSECVASNPDDAAARACIQARLGERYGGSKSKALDRCYNLGSEAPPARPPTGLTCYQGLMGNVTCK